jgi:hypothetical protein
MEETLAAADFKMYGVFLPQVIGQQHSIPEVLVITQFPGRVPKVLVDLLQFSWRQSGRPSWPRFILQPPESSVQKAMQPVMNGAGRMAENPGGFIRRMALEHIAEHFQSMEVVDISRSRKLILNGGEISLYIWNKNPFHGSTS